MANDANDPLFDDEPRGMLARLLPSLVLMCAFGGFVALAIYAYKAGSQSVNEGELMVIEADKTPVKEKPEDPGGMQFPNQDKTIFNTIASGTQTPPQVERVLPAPEEPMAKEPTASWTNEKLAAATPAVPAGPEQVFGDDDTPPAKAPEANVAVTGPQVVNVQEELGKQAVAEAAPATPAVPVAAPVKAEEPAPKLVEKLVVKEEKPVAKPKAAPKGIVQLGAYKSEAEAKADFVKIQKKNTVLAGKSPTINRADLGDKGVFYRLRVATDDAKALCAKLSAARQACMVVK